MTLAPVIATIREGHSSCCITSSYEDEGCRIDISGLPRGSLTTLDGSRFQANHQWQGRLCDRIIISQSNDRFVCAVEFKGGNSIDISVAIAQIQRGLDLLASLLRNASPQKWYPLLAYSGSMTRRERVMLRRTKISYRGSKASVDRIDCGSSLLAYLTKQ